MTPEQRADDWATRYEEAGWLGRVGLLGGGAVRLTANLVDKALDRAASTVVAAERAFRREVDPNITEAKILDEVEEPRRTKR